MAFNSGTLLLIIVPLTMAVLAVALDIASRRGYMLGALALGTLVLALWDFSVYSQAAQGVASSADSLEVIVYGFFYFVGELFLALLLTLSAVAAAATARQWWWLGGIVVVSVVPAALIFTSSATLPPNLLDALSLPHSSALVVVFVLPPVLVTCAYVMARSVRRPLAR